jgi:hypothetical protein
MRSKNMEEYHSWFLHMTASEKAISDKEEGI